MVFFVINTCSNVFVYTKKKKKDKKNLNTGTVNIVFAEQDFKVKISKF